MTSRRPIQLSDGAAAAAEGDGTVRLATTFLCSEVLRPDDATTMRYALHVRILSLRERHGILSFGDHLEQTADFDDILVVDVGSNLAAPALWATWNSDIKGAIRDYQPGSSMLVTHTRGAGALLTIGDVLYKSPPTAFVADHAPDRGRHPRLPVAHRTPPPLRLHHRLQGAAAAPRSGTSRRLALSQVTYHDPRNDTGEPAMRRYAKKACELTGMDPKFGIPALITITHRESTHNVNRVNTHDIRNCCQSRIHRSS